MEPLSTLALVAAFLAPAPLTRRPDWFVEKKVANFGTNTNDLVYAIPVVTESILMAMSTDSVLDARTLLVQEIHAYRSLEDGWDGNGSFRASEPSIREALNFVDKLPGGLPMPGVMLSSSGEVGCYWDGDSGYADISFSSNGMASFFSRADDGLEYFAESLNREAFTRDWFFGVLGAITAPKLKAA